MDALASQAEEGRGMSLLILLNLQYSPSKGLFAEKHPAILQIKENQKTHAKDSTRIAVA